MGMIDKQGRVFGKINIIDFLLLVFLITLLPLVYYVYKIADKSKQPAVIDHYAIYRDCPNCGTPKRFHIPTGQPIPKSKEAVCDTCLLKLDFFKTEPDSPTKDTHYVIHRTCPNCGGDISKEIPLGQQAPESFETICPHCKNKVKAQMLTPDPMRIYYRKMLEKGLP